MVQRDNLVVFEHLQKKYNDLKTRKFFIDFSRGRPSAQQLDLSLPILEQISSKTSFVGADSIDVRNYGCVDGIIECKKMMSILLGVNPENVFVFGNSSLKAMYDQVGRSYTHGVCGSTPWCKLPKVKWLCPVPGYDRHFAITEHFGIEMINIPMNDDGPNMDLIEEYIKDESVKGIWCTPIYSNPSGITYSQSVVKRFAQLKPAAADFRIYWDKAYAVHGFEKNDELLNIFDEAKKCSNEDIVFVFSSTSKITFPSGGIAAMGCSSKNLLDIKNKIKYETISYDKINQLRHSLFFNDEKCLLNHVSKSMQIIYEKVRLCLEYFENNLFGYATWSKPTGGYFILIKTNNVAKEVVKSCADCGLILNESGSCHPYHFDDTNSYIRIAPSGLEMSELIIALQILCVSIQIETLKKQYIDKNHLLRGNMKVSIIVPVYNVERYLGQCLESILKQTYSNLEIILINDGSTDSSKEICKEYAAKDQRIKLVDKQNGGLGSSRNKGLDICTGEYIYFIDSDDWIDPETIENMLVLSVLTNSDIVCTDGVVTDGVYEYDRCFQSKDTSLIKPSSVIVSEILKNTIMSQVVKGLYLRNCWNMVRFPENRLYEDIPTTYKAFALANQIAYLGVPFYKYRHNNSSISYTPNPLKSYHIFLGFKDHFDYAKLNNQSIVNECLPNCIIYALSTYFHYCSDAKNELEFCKNEVIDFLEENKAMINYKQIIKSRRFMLRLFYFSKALFWLFCKLLKLSKMQRLLNLEVK